MSQSILKKSDYKKYNICLPSSVTTNILNKLYKNANGYNISDIDYKLINTHSSSVYGEITDIGIRKLFNNNKVKLNENDIVYDLGSGTGAFCSQISLEYPVNKVYGVELSKTRHNFAIKTYNKLKKYNEFRNNITFINNDFLKTNINNATVIFFDSVCFNDNLMNKMKKKFEKLKNLRTIITLKDFNEPLQNFNKYIQNDIKCSWSNNVSCYVYYK